MTKDKASQEQPKRECKVIEFPMDRVSRPDQAESQELPLDEIYSQYYSDSDN